MARPSITHILSFGAATSVGASPAVAMAATQAGMVRMVIVPEEADEDDPDAANVAKLSTLAVEDPAGRGRALLSLALDHALAALGHRKAGPVGVWTVGPPLLDGQALAASAVASRLGVVPTATESVGAHGCAGLLAIERAAAALTKNEIELAVVAGFDVRSHEQSVAEAMRAGRCIGPGRSFGSVLGEAGAALLLTNDRGLQRLGLRPRATLEAVAAGHEPNPFGSSAPCVGRGLTDAVRRVLEALPAQANVHRIFCDLNGERHRADEWGFTTVRVAGRLQDPGAVVAPAMAWGDCGAAHGLLLLALAAAVGERDGEAKAHMLVWTSSDGPERAAALLSAAPPSSSADHRQSRSALGQIPAWADALDREILEEMAEECSFRYEQRAYQLSELEAAGLMSGWRAIERTEDTIDALVVGLAECGPPALEIVEEAATSEVLPERVYVAVRTHLERGHVLSAIKSAAGYLAADAAVEGAIVQAFVHARRPCHPPEERVSALLAAGPPFCWLALQVAESTGVSLPSVVLARLTPTVPAARESSFLSALGRIAPTEFRPYLVRWEKSARQDVRREAALADVLLGSAAARDSLWARAEVDPALLLPAALVANARQAAGLLARAENAGDDEAILAVAIAGDAQAIPWLLDRLGHAPCAKAAACALELLLGVAPVEEYELPDEDESVPPRKMLRISLERASWGTLAAKVLASHPKDLRIRGGAPAGAAAAISLLDRPHLSWLARRYLGLELAVRCGAPRIFDASGLVRSQRAWLATARQSAAAQPPGSWEMARHRGPLAAP
jgi:3-oxoacyl-[acyl-carrier-protein] synthase-1